MAEEDVLLVAVKMDADGAITDTELLDNKFKSLSKTFRNSKEPMVGAEQSQKKLNKAIKEGQKETKDANVANISAMLALEGLTSGLNQSISARYKQIDADLAAGKLSEEQAEAKRKEIKQQEFITGSLEQYIAVARLAIATNALLTAARGLDVKATIAQIKANKILTFVMKQNPAVKILIVILALAAAFYVLETRLGLLTTT
jgi:ribosomal protein S13